MLPQSARCNPQAGFTLLLASLIASIVLVLGSSIFSIAKKQIQLASIGRSSQYAFYAADTAAECALYYDIRFRAFGTASAPTQTTVICDKDANGGDLSAQTSVVSNSTAATSTFQINLFSRDVSSGSASNSLYCTQVTIAKNPSAPYTVIHADGYSTSCATISSSATALQRSVELRY